MYILCLSKGVCALQKTVEDGYLPTKTIGFIPTAGETYKNPYFVDESRARLKLLGLKLIEIDITNNTREEIIDNFDKIDGLHIAGGNVFYLLQQLRAKSLDDFITSKIQAGMPYFGESAGAVLLAKSIAPASTLDDPDSAPNLKDYSGLNLLNFFPLPHCDREKYHDIYAKFLSDNLTLDIVKYNDDQAIFTDDGFNYKILTSEITKL